MRRVKITYEDGRVVTYRSLTEAASDMRCDASALRLMSIGHDKRIMAMLRVSDVAIEEHSRLTYRLHSKPDKRPVRCTSEAGEVVECRDMQDARRRTNPEHYIQPFMDDGEFHWGWRYEIMDKPNPYVYDQPVSDDVIRTVYEDARMYVYKKLYWISVEDRRDLIQTTAARIISDISTGKLKDNPAYPWDKWLYINVRQRAHHEVEHIRPLYDRRVDSPIDDDALFMDYVSGGLDDEYGERLMFEEMPEDIREAARMLYDGCKKYEIRARLGLRQGDWDRIKARLVEWLTERVRQRR